MATIYVTDRAGGDHVLEAASGRTIMEPLREIDNGIEALCGGMCSCSTCHIYIDDEWCAKLKDLSDDELDLLEDTECFKGEGASRLACQVTMNDDLDGMKLTIAPEE
ncbi:MAG: 2Fe-2S iron-sulfur cluster-binding protein [Gammaproteobacteria bacterium]|jgi:2Fe-2S ferredoxin|nr:ferredoxin [Chromatiales bacterium]MDP6673920.1 2Fe-2S iron-sulfur cluster-binding protein [Gammaproteobacteria bacterium]